MENIAIHNPFLVGKYVSDHYFCDREKETDFLIKQVENGRHMALISQRRLGKTGLLFHLFNQNALKENYYPVFIDIYATSSLEEFVYLFGKSIFEQIKPQKVSWKERFFQVISSFRVGFKLDVLTGEPIFDIGLGDIVTPETTIDEIFSFLESLDKPCVVAIDEFQQVSNYPGQVEALLRTKIQQCKQTVFIFSGSKRHLMFNMFNSPIKPFYNSSISMSLDAIPLDRYIPFAKGLFEENGKRIDKGLIEKVYNSLGGCTWFVQVMMNELFAITQEGECCSNDKFQMAWDNVIMMQDGVYKEMLSNLAPRQKMLLQAIAKEGKVQSITSSEFVKKYNLSSASSVQAAIKVLLAKDIVTKEDNCYWVYDYFFGEWLRKVF